LRPLRPTSVVQPGNPAGLWQKLLAAPSPAGTTTEEALMEIQIKSTDKITRIDGVPVRVWEGVTAEGVPCFVFVHRIAVRNEHDHAAFQEELTEQLPPGREVPLRIVLV
jgi:hypothetical protein